MALSLYWIKTPRMLQRLFARFTWSFSSNSKAKEIYLTFDDGPIPEVTEFVLSQLKKYNAKATFFCIGDNIRKHPIVFQQVEKEGHRIANHTYHHINGWEVSVKAYLNDIEKTEKEIEMQVKNTTKTKTKLFRPPYGKIKRSQVTALLKRGYKVVLWEVLSADFDKNISKEKCLNNVLKNVKSGSIVVFHDSIKAKEKLYFVLPKVLEEFTKKGYVFKAIP